MNFLIVDDTLEHAQHLKKDLTNFFEEKCDKLHIHIVHKDFQNIDLSKPFDFVFLDIDLPELNGFMLAKKIKAIDPKTNIVFVSAKSNLVHESLFIQPFFFIRKSDYSKDIQTFFNLIHQQTYEDRVISLNYNYNKSLVVVKNIIYLEVKKHVLYVYTKNGTLYDNRSLKDFLNELNNSDFVQIHKSFAINFNYLISYSASTGITLIDDINLNIGRSHKENFEEKYKEFLIK